MSKKRRRRSPEQIIRAIQEGEAMLSGGRSLAEVYQKLEITESTWLRWKKLYGGMLRWYRFQGQPILLF